MRERHSGRSSYVPVAGITPAYAGKTWNEDDDTANYRDHPRVCGKDT